MDILSNSHVWCAHMKWKDHINPLNFLNSHTRNINVKPFNRRAMGKTNKKIEEKRYIFTANIRYGIYSLLNGHY